MIDKIVLLYRIKRPVDIEQPSKKLKKLSNKHQFKYKHQSKWLKNINIK